MIRTRRLARPFPAWFALVLTVGSITAGGWTRVSAGEVSGKVVMPDICSPEISPAVAALELKNGGAPAGSSSAVPTDVALINQRGLQFSPRVQAIALGQTLRFTNEDAETHNVHVVSAGNPFNESMAPGQPKDFTPLKPGLVRLACDVHSHMRGYVIVSASPWVRVCSAKGRFRFENVPDGDYTLTVWHEMGKPLVQDVKVSGASLDLGSLTLSAPEPLKLAPGETVPARKWADVIDRIGVLLAAGLDSAGKPNGFKKARKLADDAYWGEFEPSDMENAVRLHLGLEVMTDLERKFRAVVPALQKLSEGKQSATQALETTRPLLLTLVKVAEELNRKGVTDGDHLQAAAAPVVAAVPTGGDSKAQLAALRKGLDGVRAMADNGESDDAAAEMSAVYFDEFEPLERFIAVHKPADVRPLELQFNAIRGAVGQGLKGNELGTKLAALQSEAKAAVERSIAIPEGTFGPAFAASLLTIVREGVEVILLLTMLLAIVAKTGQAWGRRAIGWGVGLALLASAATALGLNLMVASARGRTREILEGGVMLAAAGLLFYVSYWLISQSESKRWMNFLKRQAAKGAETGHQGFFALAATAFIAVYREGAETALMYQAMIGSQAGARLGLTGLAAGLGVGFVLLGAIAYLIKTTSVKLPLRAFFQVTGGLLFAMAVVFAGNGVFELQASGILKSTPLEWLGGGLPAMGFYPNVQALSVQALLLAGAALALIMILSGDHVEPKVGAGKERAKVGV